MNYASSLTSYHCNNNEKKDKNKLFRLPFSQDDLLVLQAMFTTFGMHTIRAHNHHEGRMIIETILGSLHDYYHTIGVMTNIDAIKLDPKICDILQQMSLDLDKRADTTFDLEHFFTIHPCFDFIWIEQTPTIQQEYPIAIMRKIFEMYHVDERMTVIVVEYEN